MVQERYFFKKTDRLKSRKQIEQVFQSGNSFSIFPFKIWFLKESFEQNQELKIGVSASSRNFKRAVDRNRIKRLMRENWRLKKNELQQLCRQHNCSISVFIVYISKDLPDFDIVDSKFEKIIHRLKKECIETN